MSSLLMMLMHRKYKMFLSAMIILWVNGEGVDNWHHNLSCMCFFRCTYWNMMTDHKS